MSSDYTFVSDEKLIHITEEDEENEFNEVEENNSEEKNYEPPEKSRKDYEIVPFKTKLRVVTLARQNPKWKLKTLQNKGTQRLKSKSELNRWEKTIKYGLNRNEKSSFINSWTYTRFEEARQSNQLVSNI
ncbi:hypothetical protein M0802_014563 [Mischocyttarus mexicanus]|nr:hypothetical protein M0802_014563 [Mischocyttarus mexicanus]